MAMLIMVIPNKDLLILINSLKYNAVAGEITLKLSFSLG